MPGAPVSRLIFQRYKLDNVDISLLTYGLYLFPVHCLTVKIDGTYRLIDCYLASPFLPSNKGYIESHWFLARPLTMIYTHFPASIQDQFLDPPVTSALFFALPHVRTPFFKHHLQVLDYEFTFLELVDDDGELDIYLPVHT
jgi:transglutaminase/protease-like cytokinesis protein 3